jgi:hypothetical protein
MNIFGKTLLISVFLAAIMLASCSSGQSTHMISDADITEIPISTVGTAIAGVNETATAKAPTATLQPTETDTPTPIPTYTPLPELPPDAMNLQWITAYGLPGNQSVTKIRPTKDGGFILVGNTVLLKLRADGLILWQTSLREVTVLDVLETSAGDIILAGDHHWIKLDSQGNLLWQHMFEEPTYHTGPILRLVEEGNGSIVVEAVGSRAVFNAEGELQFFTESDSQTSSGNIIDRLDEDQRSDMVFVRTTADGGMLLVNRVTQDFGDVANIDTYFPISRLSGDGSVLWQRQYGGYFLASDEEVQTFETKSGDFIVAITLDYFANQGDRNDVWMFRQGSDGGLRWMKMYATEGEDAVTVIQELSNGDLIFAGQTSGAGTGGQDMWVLKTNDQGEIPNCGLMFDGSAGTYGSFPEVETTTPEAEQRPFGDNGDAQAIPLCAARPSDSPSRAPSTEKATVSSTPAPATLTPGALTCQLNMNQNIHVLDGTNVWSQPDVVNGSLLGTLPAETSAYVISAPAWGRIQETAVSGWWWEISNKSDGASTGWIWEGRIEECN